MVTNMWPRTGRESYGAFVVAQVDALRREGVEIDVLVVEGDRNPAAYLAAIPEVGHRARSFGADLVHAHFGLSGWVASWQPYPLVVSFCGTDLLGARGPSGSLTLKSRAMTLMSRRAAARADAIICKSDNLRDALRDPRDRARARIIPNGVDLDRFSRGDQRAARLRLGLDPARPLVLFPYDGEKSPHKRFPLASAAVELVRKEWPDVELLQVREVPHERMPDYYRAADCMVLTSRSEGSPNTVKEALACGLAVVSVDVGDVRRWLEPVPGCSVVSPEPAALAGAIGASLAHRGRVDASVVLPRIADAAIARELLGVYRSLIPA